jgi:hypothetical protein
LIHEVVIFLFARLQGNCRSSLLGNVTDIALDHLFIAHQIHIADEFHLDQAPILGFERQVIVTDDLILL